MFQNYFKTALRNFLREKGSSLLNISGLTLGITCSLVLFLMVKHLASFDNYHVNRDRIYRVVTESDGNNGKFYTPGVPTALPDAFLQDFPEAEQVTFASYRGGALIKVPQKIGEAKKYQEEAGIVFAQPNFFKIFDRPLLVGSAEKGLDDPNEAIISRSLAKKYFGKEEVVGEVVKNFHTVSLHEPLEPTVLMNDIGGYKTLSLKINQSQLKSIISEVKTKWEAAYPEHIFDYQFLDEHIREFYEGEQKMSILLTVFTSMAIFIGCLGLFGLATFMANQKTKEIGVRKAMGASVESIVILFSREYVKLIVIGFLLAAPFVWFLMNKWLEGFAYKITIGPSVFIMGLAITLVIAVLTVGYRSFKAAIVNPIKSLRYE